MPKPRERSSIRAGIGLMMAANIGECDMAASYLPQILDWYAIDFATDVDEDKLARIEADADAAASRLNGMHDERVNIMCEAAFNGLSDSTGDDDYGCSYSWLDLADHVMSADELARHEVPAGVDYWTLPAYLASWRDMAGCRYALVAIDSNGMRSAVGYETREDMMAAYREREADYLGWLDEE